eukprot:7406178-Karenia_brevis.AAC.1
MVQHEERDDSDDDRCSREFVRTHVILGTVAYSGGYESGQLTPGPHNPYQSIRNIFDDVRKKDPR